ncbi:hypothetical protein BKA62DRAFT_763933 [Auriculariales sp. MPI-PUGE-AT-0066]|nr:hypothetical protein BKA62DRAFT_763933 [Auriculariales sp. MPI-PUGE-AT-0066]
MIQPLQTIVSVVALVTAAAASGPREVCTGALFPSDIALDRESPTEIINASRHNPTLDCSVPFTQLPRTPICVRKYKPVCEWWVATETASCTALVAEYAPQMPNYGLNRALFIQLNDDLNKSSCTLNIGQEFGNLYPQSPLAQYLSKLGSSPSCRALTATNVSVPSAGARVYPKHEVEGSVGARRIVWAWLHNETA